MTTQSYSVQHVRWAVLAKFFFNGVLIASWVSRIPQIQARLDLSEGELGIALMGIAVGVVVALSIAGGMTARFGSQIVTATSGALMALLLIVLGGVPNFWTLWITLFLFGGFISLMDVAMNAEGVEVERAFGKPIMSSFHAVFSIGGFIGAGIGALMAWLEVAPLMHFLAVSVPLLGVLAVSARPSLPKQVHAEDDSADDSIFQLPPRALWPLGAVAFCSSIGEGAMADWSGVYLVEIVGTTAGVAALGFAAFSLTMTIGRLLGDTLTRRFSSALLVRWSGALAFSGMALAIAWPEVVPTLIGFALVGLGLSVIVPLAFSAAGNLPDIPSGTGIAGVATIGYAGFLAGPPIIGLFAEVTSLRIAFIVVMLLVGSLWFSSQALKSAQPEGAAD